MDLEVGRKYRIRMKSAGRQRGSIPGLSQKGSLVFFLESIVAGVGTRHFVFRAKEGWKLSLSDWDITEEYEIRKACCCRRREDEPLETAGDA
jgi:hypothetical protein